MGKIINSIFDVVRDEWHEFVDDSSTQANPAHLEEQLRALYGRGEISQERYHQLRYRLYRGLVTKMELNSIHQEAIRKQESQRNYLRWQGSPELEQLLDRMYSDLVWVNETRDLLKGSLEHLHDDVSWIGEQAEAARQDAEHAMPDETTARASLQVWQKLHSLSQSLDGDLQAMERDIHNLDTLENEIKAAIVRLNVFQSRERLAGLSQRIHGDLVTPLKSDHN